MKAVEIFWTPFSLWNLEEIKKFIFSQSKSQTITEKFIQKLFARVEQLIPHPNSGKEEELLKSIGQQSPLLFSVNL